ncbi:MAG: TetR/AcrR family transcriptional regulator [Actinomycetota bacterium]
MSIVASDRSLTSRGEERREQLVATATRLFAEHGVRETSVARIIDELGVGKGVFYWYFPSKDALVVEILNTALADLRAAQRDALTAATDPLDRICLAVRASMRWYAEHDDLVRLFEWADNHEAFADQLRGAREVALSDIERHIRAAVSAGQIPPGHPSVRAEAVLGASLRLTRGVLRHRGVDPDEMAEAAIRFCIAGLKAG